MNVDEDEEEGKKAFSILLLWAVSPVWVGENIFGVHVGRSSERVLY